MTGEKHPQSVVAGIDLASAPDTTVISLLDEHGRPLLSICGVSGDKAEAIAAAVAAALQRNLVELTEILLNGEAEEGAVLRGLIGNASKHLGINKDSVMRGEDYFELRGNRKQPPFFRELEYRGRSVGRKFGVDKKSGGKR